jgi:L-alanine-DL-glutamate epimerase-like enolase superfamily enzyme
MAKIDRIEIFQVDLAPKVVRTDAIQSFVKQETPIVRVRCDDGAEGIGYTYTIGTGGSSVMALLRDHLAPKLIGRDARQIESIWKDLFFHTHATAVGAITSLSLAAIAAPANPYGKLPAARSRGFPFTRPKADGFTTPRSNWSTRRSRRRPRAFAARK